MVSILKNKLLIASIVGTAIIAVGLIIFFSTSGNKKGDNLNTQNETKSTQKAEENLLGSISDNPVFFRTQGTEPACDLEEWIVENIKPNLDKILEASKFVSSGNCDNSIPFEGAKFVTKKLLSSPDASSDAEDFYEDLAYSTGLSVDNKLQKYG